MQIIISKKDIIAAVAFWGIKQSPYFFPKNLEIALTALSKRIDEKKIFKTTMPAQSPDDYLEITEDKLKVLINDLIFNTPEVAIWNVTKTEQTAGITDPTDEKRTVKFGGADRTGPWETADNSFIDLYALEQNVFTLMLTESAQ